jgi:hypothetical protein
MMMNRKTNDFRYAMIALALMALLGVVLVFLFPGCPEQDTEYHFLEARSVWDNPTFLVDVWARPLYTSFYALPALLGFTAARLCAVGIGVVIAWQTWCLACDLRLERAWITIPLLLGQPVFFELYPDLLTEPLFALVFVVALRWHLRGWTRRGMLAASFLPLARPEGVFLCLLWGVWVIGNEKPALSAKVSFDGRIVRALASTLMLASGVFLWWVAATCITRDPLFILHNWPATWHQGVYGRGTLLSYSQRAAEFTGLSLAVPFLIGLWSKLRLGPWMPVTSSFLLLFLLHTLFRAYGLFGEAGYPRYMVSVAPVIAMLTLVGWNTIAARIEKWPKWPHFASGLLGGSILVVSLVSNFLYLDSFLSARDPIAIREMSDWLSEHPLSFKRLVWSNARMCIVSGLTLEQSPSLSTSSREATRTALQDMPPGTLVFWDDHFGPDWFGLTAAEIESIGYRLIRTRRYSLPGVMALGGVNDREVELSLLLKP